MQCPNCGAQVHGKFCEFCGSELKQENTAINITNNYYGSNVPLQNNPIDNNPCSCPRCGNTKTSFKRERISTTTNSSSQKRFVVAGRKGQSVSQSAYRTIGICQSCGYTWNPNASNTSSKAKKTWLWILGWLCIFPVPLTILLLRNKKLNPKVKYSIIAVVWVLFLLIGISGNTNETEASQNTETSNSSNASTISEESSIQSLSFLSTDDVVIKIGERCSPGYLKVNVKINSDFSPEDVIFVSDNPDVATINFTHDALTTYLYYEIIGIAPGETEVYAISEDGIVESERITVTIPKPIEIESLTASPEKTELFLNETASTTVSIYPDNAENKTLTWYSRDESVATVDNNGIISAIGEGSTVITAKAANDVSTSFEIIVNGSKKSLKLTVSRSRQDDLNIGDDWSFLTELNGESTARTYLVSIGDTLKFHVKITENDDNPDIGEVSTTYTVTEEDYLNGFEVSLDVYVTENGGKNSGKQAHYIVTYTFFP